MANRIRKHYQFMRLHVIIITMLCSFSLRAQKEGQAMIDSLIHILPTQKEDTQKARLFITISRMYNMIEPRKGFPFADSGMALARSLNWQRGIADMYNNLGLLTGDTGNNTIARTYFEKSLSINQALDAQPSVIANLNNIGRGYARESDFTNSSDFYFKALALAERSGYDEQAALIGTNLISLYILQKDYQKAAAYAASTIKKGRATNALTHVAKAYELLGVIYLETGDTLLARKNFDSALVIDEKQGNDIAIIGILSNLGTAEADPKKGIALFLKAQQLVDKIYPNSENAIVNLANLGLNYLALAMSETGEAKKNDLALAEEYLKRADRLCVSVNDPKYETDIQSGLADVQESKGDYKSALEHFKRYTTINDSIFSQKNKNKIATLESQRSIDLKNKEIENKEFQITKQRQVLWLLLLFLALLAAMGVYLYRHGVARKKTNIILNRLNDELSHANKVKSKFFGILSHDLRSPVANLLNFLQLQKKKPGSMNASEIEAYWEKVGGSAAALLETMETILLWSKDQMEYLKPRLSSVEIDPLFIRLQKSFADIENVGFHFYCDGTLVAQTDENYLFTIMQNLTANAIRALAKTENAQIVWKASAKENDIYISISDNGPGVSEKQVTALYDETAIVGARQGMGLHIIRDLAKAINCSISMQSQPGMGTAFVLSLPFNKS